MILQCVVIDGVSVYDPTRRVCFGEYNRRIDGYGPRGVRYANDTATNSTCVYVSPDGNDGDINTPSPFSQCTDARPKGFGSDIQNCKMGVLSTDSNSVNYDTTFSSLLKMDKWDYCAQVCTETPLCVAFVLFRDASSTRCTLYNCQNTEGIQVAEATGGNAVVNWQVRFKLVGCFDDISSNHTKPFTSLPSVVTNNGGEVVGDDTFFCTSKK